MLFFIQPLSGNCVINCQALKPLHSYRILIKFLSSLLNGAMLAGSVMRNCHNSRYFRCPVWKRKSWRKKNKKKQTHTKTEAYKLYSRVFWIFLPNVIKIDLYNFELYHFKVGAFFSETQCSSLHTHHLCEAFTWRDVTHDISQSSCCRQCTPTPDFIPPDVWPWTHRTLILLTILSAVSCKRKCTRHT